MTSDRDTIDRLRAERNEAAEDARAQSQYAAECAARERSAADTIESLRSAAADAELRMKAAQAQLTWAQRALAEALGWNEEALKYGPPRWQALLAQVRTVAGLPETLREEIDRLREGIREAMVTSTNDERVDAQLAYLLGCECNDPWGWAEHDDDCPAWGEEADCPECGGTGVLVESAENTISNEPCGRCSGEADDGE
jgi:hypothetical protein